MLVPQFKAFGRSQAGVVLENHAKGDVRAVVVQGLVRKVEDEHSLTPPGASFRQPARASFESGRNSTFGLVRLRS